MIQNNIYDFLKANKLTDKDQQTFLKEYSDSAKAKELYGFFQANQLTDKDFNSFYDTYLKKKEPLEPLSPDGGKAGTSEAQLGLKPAKIQPTIFKEPSVGEDTVLARKLAKQQRAAAEGTGVRLPAAPKVVAEERAAERALAPKIEKPTETEGQSWLSNTVSALDRGFYKNLIGNPVKGLATVIQYGTEAMTGGRVKEGPVSDALMRFGNWFNNAIDEVAPQDPEFKNSLSDQFAQALGQVGSVVLTGGFGAGGRGAAIAEQAIPKTGKLASIVSATKAGGKELVSEMTSPAAISAGLTMGQAEFERAKQAGASDDQAFEAFYKNAAVGSILEKIPVMQFLKRFNQSTAGGVTNYIKTKGVAGITGGLEEATTEVLQQIYANKTAQDIYNVNQNIFEGLTESGGIGFGVGFLLNAMGARAKVLRNEGKEAEAKVVEDQAKEFESRASKGAPAEPEVPPAAAPVVTEEVKAEEVVTPAVPQTEETLNRYLSTYRRQLAERRKELTEQGIEDIEADEQVKNIKTKISNTQESISKLGEVPPVAEEVRVTTPEAAPQAPATAISQEIADLRAKEQAEYAAMDDPNNEVKRKEIYDKYDKLITPLLEKEKEVPATKEEIKTEEYAIPEPSPTGVLQPTQERAGEEGGGRRRMESPVERVAAAQKSKTEAAKKEIERRLTKYAAPTGKQSEVNNLVEELKVFNSQKRGRLGLKKIESLKKRNELILEAKRLGFETKVYKDGSIAVKGARAIDKTFSNYSIDDKFVPLDQRGEKLKNLFNRILGLADAYGYGFDFFIPNVIIGADGKKMSTKQISNAVRDLENGIPSKGASAVLNSLEAMAEKGEVEVRVGQAVETVDIEDYFNRLEKDIADRDMELALMQEAETLPEKDLVKWVEEMAEDQSFETEIYEPDTEEITGEGREEPKVKGEGEEVIPGTAGGVVPPTRRGAPPTAAGEEGERVSGIKKGLVSERILAQVDFEKIGDKELLEKGRQIIESGEVKPKALVDKILEEKSGVLSPAEVVALITYKADLDNNIEDLSEEIARKEAAGEDIGTLGVELKSLEVERDNFDMAAVITAQQQSMSFRLRRFMLDRDFNLIVAINKYKRANNGVIPAEVEEVFKEVDSKIKEVNKKLKEEAAKVYEKEGEEAAKNIVDDVQREQAEKVAKNRIEKARKKRASLLEKYRKGKGGGLTLSTGGLSTEGIEFVGELLATYIQEGIGNAELIIKKIIDNFRDIQGREPSDEVRKDIENIVNDELARPFMAEDGSLIVPDKFIRSLVSKGATTIEQMTDAAFAELEPQVPGLTKRQVRDAITKYGKKVNPRIDELTAQINQAKRIGRLISELEDLQKMSPSDFIIKYKKKKPSNTTEAEKVLRKQINVLKKELDIDAETRKEERRIEKAIKDAEESLAEYQRRIDELDFSARERGLPETPELKKARQARDEKRKEYESLKRLRPSTRLDASKKAVRKKIEELQERLRTGNYSKTPKAKKPIDAELYILNAEKEALQERVAREQRKLEKTTVRDVLKEIANIPRTLVSGLFDMGAAFSQGVYRIYSNPILSAKAFTEGAKQFFSEKRHDQWLADLRSSPEFKLLKDDMKIAISDPDGKISEQEGVIIAKYANFLYNTIARAITFGYRPATKLIQSLNPILASQRAFDGYMNYIRVNSALKLAKALENDGYTPESNPEVFEQAGDFVNTTTGRASLGSLDKSAGWLSSILFAPRKVAAELKLFTPYAFYYYAKMPAAVRKRALLNFGTFAMSVIASHTLLKAALDAVRGDDEEEDREFWDSDSPNFMSFKIGNQRVSFLGGVKTTIVFMSRLLGDRFVDQFGRESKFGERFGKKINTKLDLVLRFGLGKLAPTPGVIRDIAEKPNYEDYDEIYQNVIMPIWLQDAKEMQKDNPAEMQALFHLLGFVGANVRTVNPDSMKDKIVFKEKVRGEEVKRNVNLTEEQVIDFQNIYNNELKKKLRLINTEINRAADDKERAKVVDAAREKARNAAQEKLEIKHKTEFRKFPEQEKEKEGKALQRAKEKMN